MANDFDSPSKIIEYWRFENDLTAGKNPGGAGVGHDLTASAGGVTYVDVAPMEGSYSLDLERDSNQWASITDANLLAGFPLKSGDTVKKVSWACWIKPESVTGNALYIISKFQQTTKYCLSLSIYLGYLSINWGKTNGTAYDYWDFAAVSAGTKYHVGVAVDGIAKTTLCRVYNATTQVATSYTKTNWAAELSITDAPFVVGNEGSLGNLLDYDGLVDEVVVANAVLTAAEFDAIRAGTFNQANPATLNVATSLGFVTAPGDNIYQSFMIF